MTAELAVLLPAVVMLLVLVLQVGVASAAQVRCLEAARTTARLVARGDSPDQARQAGAALAPAGARIAVQVLAERVQVTVHASVSLPLLLGAVPVQAQLQARRER